VRRSSRIRVQPYLAHLLRKESCRPVAEPAAGAEPTCSRAARNHLEALRREPAPGGFSYAGVSEMCPPPAPRPPALFADRFVFFVMG